MEWRSLIGRSRLKPQANGQGQFTLEGLGPDFIVLAGTDELVCDVGLNGKLAPEQEAAGLAHRIHDIAAEAPTGRVQRT